MRSRSRSLSSFDHQRDATRDFSLDGKQANPNICSFLCFLDSPPLNSPLLPATMESSTDNTAATPTTAFTTDHSSVQAFKIPSAAFLARHFPPTGAATTRPAAPVYIATGAIVFDRPSPRASDPAGADSEASTPPRVLLLQRAPHDSSPLTWETPGGGTDDDDPSILYACTRELREEAALAAAAVGPLVRLPVAGDAAAPGEGGPGPGEHEWGERMGGQFFFTRKRKLVCKFSFIVDVPEVQTAGVVIDPAEHASFVWATEEEVVERKMAGEDGIVLKFITEDQRVILLEAFRLWRIGFD